MLTDTEEHPILAVDSSGNSTKVVDVAGVSILAQDSLVVSTKDKQSANVKNGEFLFNVAWNIS